MKTKYFAVLLFLVQLSNAQNQTFISFGNGQTTLGSQWKYLDNGTNQGTAWRGTSFNDTSWATGSSELGYGETDQNTTLSFGADSNNKYITSYFRKSISIPNLSLFSGFVMNVKRDDGIVVYVNGNQVFINNLTASPTYTTLASLASDDGNSSITTILSPSVFVNGNNVIAVEIHQNTITSSDITFDMELIGTANPILTRGPYLQVGTKDAVTLRWRTNIPTDSKVTWGTTFGTYSNSLTDPLVTTEHKVRITSLSTDTKYFYTIGSSTYVLQSDSSNNFTTLPADNTSRKMRFIGLGDCGNNSSNQINVRNSVLNYIGSNTIDGLLLFGDNAYTTGTDLEYQTNFFDIYKDNFLKNIKLYPAPGNHDYGNSSANTGSRTMPYHLSFTVPQAGEIGGVPSGVVNYYSYDIGDVHFVSLDSYGKDDANTTKMYDMNGAQVTWLLDDLAVNTKKWTVVYFHHPPYTKTSHNSDTELDLVAIRERFIRVLEQNGVDMVLCGHSHGYERSFLLKEFYNTYVSPLSDADFNPSIHTATGNIQNATYDGTANSCAFTYNSGKFNHGTVYAVSGSAGQVGGSSTGYPHNCMFYSNNTNGGAFYFEVHENRLDAKFISYNSAAPTVPVVRDQFTIFKDVNKITNITVSQNQSLTLTASWNGVYNWITNGNATTKSISISNPNTGLFVYQVKDQFNCITDVFNITVIGATTSVSAKFFIEGYYDVATHAMRPVKANQGIGASATEVDTVTFELRNPTTYAIVASTTATLGTNGLATAIFNSSISGSYYLVIKHRNMIETWSANPITISTVTSNYDFSNQNSKAYGANMVQVEPGVWALYSGDINHDSNVDNGDYSIWEADANDFLAGYYPTDLNGDGNVDNADYSIWESNSNNFIFSIRP
jgi:hypothetical protein